jgi:hypothetical protein
MKESFLTPLLLALFFVAVTLGISSVSSPAGQVAQVGSTNIIPAGSLPVSYAVTVSSDLICDQGAPRRTVGFFTQPVDGGYFSIYGAGGVDLGDRQPGLSEIPVGSYTWEGIPRSGYMRSGVYAGTFSVTGVCPTQATATSTQPAPVIPPAPLPQTPTSALIPVTIAVSTGGACAAEKFMTPVAVTVEPRGATVVISKENGNVVTTLTQGVTYLPNGVYIWRGEASLGYSISGVSTGTFSLDGCPTRITPSVLVGGACDLIDEGVPVDFSISPEGAGSFSLKATHTGETLVVEPGVEYLRNGTYTWTVVPRPNISPTFTKDSTGTFTISACQTSSGAYTPPKPGTILFFRDGKLIEPSVRSGETIALRVDLTGVKEVSLERVGKDERAPLGVMTRDGQSSRWLFAWSVGNPPAGEYTIIARAKSSPGGSVVGSRLVTILSSGGGTSPAPFPQPPAPSSFAPTEFPDISLEALPEEPIFTRIGGEESVSLSLPVRGVADLISTKDILSVKNILPESIRSPEDLRVFCSTPEHDDVCLGLVPGALQTEAADTIKSAREEIARAFRERPEAGTDSDQDGLSDFDEIHFFGTDPAHADSDKDGKKDGWEILNNTNPLVSGKTQTVTFENPVLGGEEKNIEFSVRDVVAGVRSEGAPLPVTFSGKAPAGTMVTLYIYSDPIIVRLETDKDGLWSYTLTKELPDGTHKAYVAMTDSAGRILAKSAPLPFVKSAAAVSISGPTLPGSAPSAPSLFSGASLYALVLIILGVLGFALLSIGIIVRSRRREDVLP